MKLSQIGTKFCKVMTATLLISSQFAMAADRPEMIRDNIEFTQRLKQVYDAKKRPFPALSTAELPYKTDKMPKIHKDNKTAIKMGGVSDGGGNAVGVTLFDFYENQGSLEISVDELVHIEPRAEQIIARLNHEIPAVNELSSGGFGDILKNSLREKKIYLESKEISSEACKNQSLVSSEQQAVVACQSDAELRLSLKWLRSTDSANRAGLITHELTLGWARSRLGTSDKDETERMVREMNREIFNGHGDIAATLSEKFNVKAYNSVHFAKAKALAELVKNLTVSFCNDPKADLESSLAEYSGDAFLAELIPASIKSMRKVSTAARNGGPADTIEEAQNNLCEDYIIDKTPIHQPNMDILPANCVRHAQDSANLILQIRGNAQGMADSSTRYFMASSLSTAKSSANLCSGLRGIELEKKLFMTQEKGHRMMRETYFEAINYIRFLLKQEGVTVSFTDGK